MLADPVEESRPTVDLFWCDECKAYFEQHRHPLVHQIITHCPVVPK